MTPANVHFLIGAVIWYAGVLYVGIKYWDASMFGFFIETIFRAVFWPIWLLMKGWQGLLWLGAHW
jgi:hypothetical protein